MPKVFIFGVNGVRLAAISPTSSLPTATRLLVPIAARRVAIRWFSSICPVIFLTPPPYPS